MRPKLLHATLALLLGCMLPGCASTPPESSGAPRYDARRAEIGWHFPTAHTPFGRTVLEYLHEHDISQLTRNLDTIESYPPPGFSSGSSGLHLYVIKTRPHVGHDLPRHWVWIAPASRQFWIMTTGGFTGAVAFHGSATLQ